MRTFLVFHLEGPLASWGDIASGELRPSHNAPTRSAIVGLIACCLGIERAEEEQLRELDSSLRFGVRVDRQGVVLHDYHTAQTPAKSKYRDLATRREEIVLASASADLETILSRREYRSDAAYTVVVWTAKSDLLERIRNAILEPTFTPFLGRKSCVISAPMRPGLVEAENLASAFTKYGEGKNKTENDALIRYIWEGDNEGFERVNRIDRHERVVSRARWQFGPIQMNETFVAKGDPNVLQ